ncbi:hypothetical protein FB451DRAFT_1187373 [Mycena latifolia]|nr:hypothetical protein FB451DRAFT_1187373 [Mycena latifolia]
MTELTDLNPCAQDDICKVSNQNAAFKHIILCSGAASTAVEKTPGNALEILYQWVCRTFRPLMIVAAESASAHRRPDEHEATAGKLEDDVEESTPVPKRPRHRDFA